MAGSKPNVFAQSAREERPGSDARSRRLADERDAFIAETISQTRAIEAMLETCLHGDCTEYETWEQTGEIPERLQHMIQR